jgi:hypothetical protein
MQPMRGDEAAPAAGGALDLDGVGRLPVVEPQGITRAEDDAIVRHDPNE